MSDKFLFRLQYLKIPKSQMTKKSVEEKKKKESNKKIFGRPQKLQKLNQLFIAQVPVLIKKTVIMQFLDYLFSHEDLEDLEDFNLPKDALQLAKMARFGRDRDGRNVLSILLDWKNVKAFVKGTIFNLITGIFTGFQISQRNHFNQLCNH